MKRLHAMPFGAAPLAGGGARFRLWAPGAGEVELVRSAGPDCGAQAMRPLDEGWFELDVERADARTRYAYRIDGGQAVPDPAARANPDDVHAPSAFVDPCAFDWPDADWRGRPWHEAVIYELHVGCFTPEGTYSAAIGRLDDLVALGITAIELMPVADFPGKRGWGYDGVLHYAPETAYGTPEELKGLVAQAHARGLMVLLDVVYNHFGPDGNYLHGYAPSFFNPAVQTPWGAAINFEAEHSHIVRDFYVHNALYWIEEFHFDGLRLDAVHAMHDTTDPHFIDELALSVRAGPGRERHVHLVLENGDNDADRLLRHAGGQPRLADAQWNDDVHHAVHVIATGESDGYYADFGAEPLRHLGRALAEGYAFQGEPSAYAGGVVRGKPSTGLPPTAFVNSIQTHDQVGNRAFGERIATLADDRGREDSLRALVACVLLSPTIPMLFMGEEYAAATPFLYFCDFEGDLAKAVTEGRRNEFGSFARFRDPAVRERIPDPNAAETFQRSKLDWSERSRPEHACWLALYTRLLAIRRDEIMPLLAAARSGEYRIDGEGLLRLRWPLGDAAMLHLQANLANATAPAAATALPGRVLYRSHPFEESASPWSVQVALEST